MNRTLPLLLILLTGCVHTPIPESDVSILVEPQDVDCKSTNVHIKLFVSVQNKAWQGSLGIDINEVERPKPPLRLNWNAYDVLSRKSDQAPFKSHNPGYHGVVTLQRAIVGPHTTAMFRGSLSVESTSDYALTYVLDLSDRSGSTYRSAPFMLCTASKA